MTPDIMRRGLVRELVWVVALKLALMTVLWSAFVRDAHVPVDAAAMAARTHATTAPPPTPREGENNDS